jgi:hypothetical protein
MDRQRVEHLSVLSPKLSSGAGMANLPDALTSFIGRSAELARVRELLGEARLSAPVGVARRGWRYRVPPTSSAALPTGCGGSSLRRWRMANSSPAS